MFFSSAHLATIDATTKLHNYTTDLRQLPLRADRVVVLILIAIAVILVVGVLVAWWIACQNRGMYPTLGVPTGSSGVYKAYCSK